MISAPAHLVRLGRAGFVFAREGVFGIVDPTAVPVPARPLLRLARLIERRTTGAADTRLSTALTRLGPSYVKLGQFLATRPDVVGAALAEDLERLQDQMPPFPQAEAEAAVAASFGKPLKAVFSSFGPAVAAASIAQVHRATVATAGETRAVAVKVLRPGVEKRFHADLGAFTFAARARRKSVAEARRLRLIEVVDTLRRSVMVEMDFRLEAAALSEMAENTKDDPDFRVPAVDWDRTTKEVLTLEWIDATPLSDRARLEAKGFDLPKLGRVLIQTFFRHALRDGFFHADMHPGNLFVDDSGRLIAVDFGIMGRLGRQGTPVSCRKSCTASSPAIITAPPRCISKPAMCRRTIRSRISPKPSAPSASRSTIAPPKTFRWQSCSRCCSRSPACSTCARGRNCCCLQKTMVVVEGVGALARSQARHVDHRRAGGARMDDAASRPRRQAGKRRAGRRPSWAVSSATCRGY